MKKPSPIQLQLLWLFANGWTFKLYGQKPGVWPAYWAMRRHGLINSKDGRQSVTDKGVAALERWFHEIKGIAK